MPGKAMWRAAARKKATLQCAPCRRMHSALTREASAIKAASA